MCHNSQRCSVAVTVVAVGTESWLVEVGIRSENELRILQVREAGLAWVGLGRLLALGKTDNAARDAGTLTLSESALSVLRHWVLSLIVIILALVQNHGASNDRVRSAQVHEQVSVLVLGVGVEAGLQLLNIANASVVDVLVRVATVRAEGVVDVASGLASVFEVTELVDLKGVEAGLDHLEFANDRGKIVWLLSQLKGAAGVRVAQEIELA